MSCREMQGIGHSCTPPWPSLSSWRCRCSGCMPIGIMRLVCGPLCRHSIRLGAREVPRPFLFCRLNAARLQGVTASSRDMLLQPHPLSLDWQPALWLQQQAQQKTEWLQAQREARKHGQQRSSGCRNSQRTAHFLSSGLAERHRALCTVASTCNMYVVCRETFLVTLEPFVIASVDCH